MELAGYLIAGIILFMLAYFDHKKKQVPDILLALLWVVVFFFGNCQVGVMAIGAIYTGSCLAMYIEKKPGVSMGDILGGPALFALIDPRIAFVFFAIPIWVSAISKKEESCFEWYFAGLVFAFILSFYGIV
jgi:hypothetical protein